MRPIWRSRCAPTRARARCGEGGGALLEDVELELVLLAQRPHLARCSSVRRANGAITTPASTTTASPADTPASQ